MKKTLLFTFALLFAMATMAQSRQVFLQESFNGSSLPTGWTIIGQNSNWSVSATQNAGGTANEMKLDWSPQFNGMTRLVTPAIDLSGVSSVVFAFKHCLDNYSGGHTIGIATSSDGGTTWHEGWTQNYSSSGAHEVNQEIVTVDLGQPNVKFCVFYNGNSYNINDWYFDDIQIFTLETLDLGIVATNLPSYIPSGNFGLGIKVQNLGVTTITSVEATYTIEGKDPVTQVFNTNIQTLDNVTLNFDQEALFFPGLYAVDFTIDKVNGEDDVVAENNSLTALVSAALTSTQKIPMIEHFSSSTCGPCVSVNTQMLNFCNNNPGRFTYTKYQMNWPGNGDPYYTNEGGTRRTYYGVSAVPQCFLDGEDQGFAAVQTTVFNEHADRNAFMDVRGSFNIQGNTISVKADVMPYIDADARLFVSVNEKETHNNVGGNGETSFHHIFMKMLTSAQGDPLTFIASELQHVEFNQDLSGTHVEEMSDLEVSIWVQNYSTHEIFNSHFAYEYTDVHPYTIENLTLTPNDNTIQATWNAPAQGNPSGYDVYLNGAIVLEGTTETSYSFDAEEGSFYCFEVIAKYDNDMTSVKTSAGMRFGDAQDMGLVQAVQGILLDLDNPQAETYVTNGNYNSHNAIVINGITCEQSEGGYPYVVVTPEHEMPYSLNVGEDFHLLVNPNVQAKGVINTTFTVESDAGDVVFYVIIDENLFTSVVELTAETKLFPNPTTGNFVVEGANMAKVEVYNLVGQKVSEQQGKVVNIDASNWEKGLYLVNITNLNGSVETRKLVVK